MQPAIEPEIPETKLEVVTLPTAEAELLATFAPELILPQVVVMPTVAEAIAPVPLASTPALEMLTIRELKKMASSAGVKNYSCMTKKQLHEAIRAKELTAV